jgi:hypothetical protein
MSDDSSSGTGPRLTLPPEVGFGRYANFVSVAHSFSEVVLDFGHMQPGRQDIPVIARLVLHPFQARQLLRALDHNLKLYERTFGSIPEPPARSDGPAGPSGTN